jgi:rhodanese-related sulfurtransferase
MLLTRGVGFDKIPRFRDFAISKTDYYQERGIEFMRKILALLAALMISVVAPASQGHAGTAAAAKAEKSFVSIGPMEAKKLIETTGDLQLVDVRSVQEYQQGALPGSTLIPFWKIMKGDYAISKDKPVLLVCAVGGRSYAAGKYLVGKGYQKVYNLSGGLSAWAKQGVPLPNPP